MPAMWRSLLWSLGLIRETEHDWWMVQVHGDRIENLFGSIEPGEYGFYTTRPVRAADSLVASDLAFASCRAELEATCSPESLTALQMSVEESTRITQRQAEQLPKKGFTFYSLSGDEDD